MSILEVVGSLDLKEPMMVVAISGWVDAGSVATSVGEHLAAGGEVVARFDPDALYDYSSSRPTVDFEGGTSRRIRWPSLTVTAVEVPARTLLVVNGVEPDLRWQEAAAALARLATAANVTRVTVVGAIPAAVPHSKATPIMITSSDPAIEPVGLPIGRLSVPASFANVATHTTASRNDVPTVGLWAQIPHYVSGTYWPGVEAVLTRMTGVLGVPIDTDAVRRMGRDLLARLDEAVHTRPEAMDLIKALEEGTSDSAFDDGGTIADEVESFLRGFDPEDNPFS